MRCNHEFSDHLLACAIEERLIDDVRLPTICWYVSFKGILLIWELPTSFVAVREYRWSAVRSLWRWSYKFCQFSFCCHVSFDTQPVGMCHWSAVRWCRCRCTVRGTVRAYVHLKLTHRGFGRVILSLGGVILSPPTHTSIRGRCWHRRFYRFRPWGKNYVTPTTNISYFPLQNRAFLSFGANYVDLTWNNFRF